MSLTAQQLFIKYIIKALHSYHWTIVVLKRNVTKENKMNEEVLYIIDNGINNINNVFDAYHNDLIDVWTNFVNNPDTGYNEIINVAGNIDEECRYAILNIINNIRLYYLDIGRPLQDSTLDNINKSVITLVKQIITNTLKNSGYDRFLTV